MEVVVDGHVGAGLAQDGGGDQLVGLAILGQQNAAMRAGQRLHLTAKEFALLTLLLRRQGQILSRSTLAEQVWDMNFDSDTNVVEVAVRRLRAKLDDPFRGKLLHNVRGMGYVLEQRSGEVLPAAVAGVEATS